MPRHPLERLLSPFEPLAIADPAPGASCAGAAVDVRCVAGCGPAEWLHSGEWKLLVSVSTGQADLHGTEIAAFTRASGDRVEATRTTDGIVRIPFSLAEAYRNYVFERWTDATTQRRLSPGLLATFYRIKRLIPRGAQLAARRALIRWQGSPVFPLWPYDESVAALMRFAIRCSLCARGRSELSFRWFWPHGAHAAIILTHDVESANGLRNAVRIADIEQERGLRSSFNIVGSEYAVDMGLVNELRTRGFEIGLHGIFHDKSLFSSRAEFEHQRQLLGELALRLRARGFRSPATHRVHDWIAELPIAYDCTVPLSDPYEPQPGGSCSPWPYFLGNVVELPYTLPQDHTLFTLLGHSSIDLWRDQVERLERSYGLVQCLTHPDPGYLGNRVNEARYVEFLDFIAARDHLWHALPHEVAGWWRQRDRAVAPVAPGDRGVARVDAGGAVALIPPGPTHLEVGAGTSDTASYDDYQGTEADQSAKPCESLEPRETGN
jgi:peptidoglycan/xylan/chitin deacetylase (PgdA/CDA1 family)